MKAIGYFLAESDIATSVSGGVGELIFSHLALSRFGNLSTREFEVQSLKAHQAGIRVVLEWDILMTETRFQRAKLIFQALLQAKFNGNAWFDAVRVQDPGAAHFIRETTDLPIQLNLETGNHNYEAIQGWVQAIGVRLERVMLSIELPAPVLEKVLSELSVPAEVLGLGPVLLLYTPRTLLSIERGDLEWVDKDEEAEIHSLNAIANSEEGLHRGFRIHENIHGTFVIHHKDYCLLDKIDELKAMGLHYFRIDERLRKNKEPLLPEVQSLIHEFDILKAEKIIQTYEQKVTRCFYRANATDVLFKKLKNMHAQRKDEAYLGEVFEVSKNRYLVLHVVAEAGTLHKGMRCRFVNTEGKEQEYSLELIRNLEGEVIESAVKGDFVILPYVKSVSVRTQVYQIQ